MRLRSLVISLVLAGGACRSASMPALVHDSTVPKVIAPIAGHGSEVGVVADSTSGYPVVGGSVYFTADSVIGVGPARPRTDLPQATTDSKGGFALRDLVPGRYTIAFADLDHFAMRRVIIVRSDEIHTLYLRPSRRARP